MELTEHSHLALFGFLLLFATFEAILLRLIIAYVLRQSEESSSSSPAYQDEEDYEDYSTDYSAEVIWSGEIEYESFWSLPITLQDLTSISSFDDLSSGNNDNNNNSGDNGHISRHIYRFLY